MYRKFKGEPIKPNSFQPEIITINTFVSFSCTQKIHKIRKYVCIWREGKRYRERMNNPQH